MILLDQIPFLVFVRAWLARNDDMFSMFRGLSIASFSQAIRVPWELPV